MSGLYPAPVIIERAVAGAVTAGNLAQLFVAPCDLEIVGLVANLGTAPGGSDTLTFNISVFPTSQQGGSGTPVAAYNAWTAANVPSITGTATNSFQTTNAQQVAENRPYALNYPMPGPAGGPYTGGPVTGYATAQATSQITENPVTSAPLIYEYGEKLLVAPDNTYTDYNGFTGTSAAVVHAGDVLTFVVAGTPGAAAGLALSLYMSKR